MELFIITFVMKNNYCIHFTYEEIRFSFLEHEKNDLARICTDSYRLLVKTEIKKLTIIIILLRVFVCRSLRIFSLVFHEKD